MPQLQAIVENSPSLEPFKSGRQRYGSMVLISFPLLEQEPGKGYTTSTINNQSYKIFPVVNLQMINLDFYAFKGRERTDFVISTEGMGNITNYMVFKDYMAIMSTDYYKRDAENDKTYFNFRGTPVGEEVAVILVRDVGEKTFIASKQASTSDDMITIDDFREIRKEDLRLEIIKLSQALGAS